MADNVTIPLTGSGDSTAKVATDDAGANGHVQMVKIASASNGSAAALAGQQTMAASLPVVVASDQAAVPVSGTLAVSGSMPVTVGTSASDLGKAEDAVAASGDTGVAILAVRRDSATAGAADGDYVNLSTDSSGRLRVGADATIPVDASFTVTRAGGADAHDAAASSPPVRIAGRYLSSPPKVSTSGDVTELATTQEGKLLTPAWTSAADTTKINNNRSSAATNVNLQSAPGANKRIVVVGIIYSHDTAGSMKLVEDPAGTPADVLGPHYFPANGGMVAEECYYPLTTNKALGYTTTGGGNDTITLRTIIENV